MSEYRNITGEIKLLQRENDFLYPVEIWLLNDQVNRNNWKFVNLEEHKDKWLGVPILVAYVGTKVGDRHNQTVRIDKNGKKYQSFTDGTAERICGSMSEKASDIRIEERDGATWTVGKGSLWAWYNHELCMQVTEWAEQGKTMSVSIEALVEEFHKDEDGVEVETRFIPLGVTLLGDGVTPAVDGAHIRKLEEIASGEFESLRLRAASYIEDPQGDNEEPGEESKIKPQKNNTEKEKKALKAFSKKQLAQLSAKFDGYSVVAAGQDDNGIHVCLMSADGATAVYTMENLDATVAPEKIMRNNAQVSFEFGEDVVTVDCCDLTDRLAGSLIESNTKVNSLTADLESARNEIKELNEREAKRRIKAAKAMAESTLNQYNAFREEKVEKEVLNSINEAIDRGDYSNCVDAEGCWVGEEAVADAVLAKCAKSQMELDRVAAQRKNGVMVWDAIGNDEALTGLSALLSEF